MTRRSRGNTIRGLWLAVAALAFSGCVGPLDSVLPIQARNSVPSTDRVATDVGVASAKLFYPLDVGNHWTFAHTITTQIVPNTGPPDPPYVGESVIEVNLIGTAQRYGRDYVVQRETHHVGTQDIDVDFLYRQDRGGLYNADPAPGAAAMATRDPAVGRIQNGLALGHRGSLPEREAYRQALLRVAEKSERIHSLALASATGGRPAPLEGEIGLLRYPLHPHATWHVRENPLIVYLVEGSETLDLPAGSFKAFNIKIDWPGLFGPNDQAHVWYGRDGLVKLQVHIESDAVDAEGHVYGSVVSDELQDLTALALVGGRSPTP